MDTAYRFVRRLFRKIHSGTLRIIPVPIIAGLAVPLFGQGTPAESSAVAQARSLYAVQCAVCHGADARGGPYGPALAGDSTVRQQSDAWLRHVIRDGIASGGMPAFPLPPDQLDAMAALIRSLNAVPSQQIAPGSRAAGEAWFFGAGKCSSCHMVNGQGSATGPDLSSIGSEMKASAIRATLLDPGAHIPVGYQAITVHLRNGPTLHGFARSQTNFEIALQDSNGQFHLLQRAEVASISEDEQPSMPPVRARGTELENLIAYLSGLTGVKPESSQAPVPAASGGRDFAEILHPQTGEWPTYDGVLSSNRYSPLAQISTRNVQQLQMKWIYTVPLWKMGYPTTSYFQENMKYFGLEATPLVVDGILYASGPQQAFALDARTGHRIWEFSRPRTPGLVGDAALATNRGLAILGDKLFMLTDDAHMIALNRTTGKVEWETVMPVKPMHYGATVAPLVVKNMVIGGVAGGDWGVRGFLAAYRASDGKLIWRHWTIPAKGEAGAESWGSGNPPETGGGSTWTTGSYDPETDTVYWAAGNPYPDGDGETRPGDDLYTDSILALDANTGKLKWYYQTTPHDVHDYDTTAPLLLVDTNFQGKPRKLLLHTDKNGFFYVLDRTDGHVLLTSPVVKVTWASGIGPDGRPRLLPTHGITCPIQGSNWNSAAFDPITHLYYVMADEECYVDLSAANVKLPKEEATMKYLEALDINSGRIVWKIPQIGPAGGKRDAGILATAGGLLFYGDPTGDVVAADARTGEALWHFPTDGETKASPMTYTVNGKQYIVLAVGPNLLGFSLP